MDPHGREALAQDGFLGFLSVKRLRLTGYAEVPAQPGIYVVLRRGFAVPRFLRRGSAGLYKGKDPNVAIAVLQLAWVAASILLYVEKAGGGKLRTDLKKQVSLLIQFGYGNDAAHWGGRYLWQLADAEDLILCWKPVADPASVKKAMLADFEAAHGRLPYANQRG